MTADADKTPATEAGRVLDNVIGNKFTDRVLAIEAEARADALREAAERVRAEAVFDMHGDGSDGALSLAAVLAILTETER